MSDQNTTPPNVDDEIPDNDSWQEVGHQFQILGESLAATLRVALEKEENRQRMKDVQQGLEAMIDKVGEVIQDAATTPEGQKVKEEAKKAANTLQDSAEHTAQEVRPHLISALKQVNIELGKLADWLK